MHFQRASFTAVLPSSNASEKNVLDEKARASEMRFVSNPFWDKKVSRRYPAINILYVRLMDVESFSEPGSKIPQHVIFCRK